jgi:hypothetical protein
MANLNGATTALSVKLVSIYAQQMLFNTAKTPKENNNIKANY